MLFGAIKGFAKKVWGNFESREELKRFLYLAVIFGLIIGTYWSLRIMKDSIFNAIVGGKAYLPYAKIVSLCVSLPLVILYGKLVDWFSRQKVFYILCGFYCVVALVFTFAFMHPTIGLANTVASPSRYIGWAWYVWVESYGSLMVALFWAFTTDITKPDAGRRGFPLIAFVGQSGNILGPSILNTRVLGFSNSAPIVGICAGLIALTGFLFWYFVNNTPKEDLVGYGAAEKSKEEDEPGFFEGLKLLLTKSYLLSIFLIIFIYEVVVTIFDFHFKSTVFDHFKELGKGEGEIQAYLSSYGTWTGIVALLCVVFGINSIQRVLGMKWSLLTLPALVTGAVFVIKFNPTSLGIAFWIMVFSKAVNYALNQPTLKQLYIPTTKDTKYKAQSWIEMFGGRSSKGTGSFVNTFRAKFGTVGAFLMMSTVLSLGLIGIWVFIALFAAKTYNKAIKEDKVVC